MSLFTRRDDLLLTQMLKEKGKLHKWEADLLNTMNEDRRESLEFDMSLLRRSAFRNIARKLQLVETSTT